MSRGSRRPIEEWRDADKVALVSGLTVPFALSWVVRTLQLRADPSIPTYVDHDFLRVLIPFLWFQLGGHAALTALAFALRQRLPHRAPWLVLCEIHLWCGCLAFSLYAVGTFTHAFAVLLVAAPVVGYLLFEPRYVHTGMVTLSLGVAVGVALPLLGVVPYAPFLARAPFEHGHLEGSWVLSAGIPALFAAAVGGVIHARLVRRLRDRQTELERISTTDPLTGLSNRTVFYARLEEEIARARRYALAVSVLMLDVDHFKAVNDSHGHAVGDQVLRDLAASVQGALRAGDVATRYGGEEFAILLPHTDLEAARTVAERLLAVARTVPIGGTSAPVTISAGAAALVDGEAGDALVGRADDALYAAKRAGRDRVVLAGS